MDEYAEALLDREDVTHVAETVELDAEEYAATRERARSIDGGVAVVTRNDDGELLLVENDWSDGYVPPGGGVEPGEHPEAAAIREAEEETGVEVELERPVRVDRRRYVREDVDGDESYRGGYDVTYLARPVGDATVADDPGLDDETIEDVAWFDDVPERTPVPDLLERFLDAPSDAETDR
jgi:8-oxo-dGTP pyrophosphatase MutT (NUDIX family)